MSKLLAGSESIHAAGDATGIRVSDFWRWSASDLLSNATRGVFAEFLVANAIGHSTAVPRKEWDKWDLNAPEGIRVEVKSAAYIQSWEQKRLSDIRFLVPRPKAPDGTLKERPAHVYVFALLAHQDKATVDPLDLSQWQFFALSARKLDDRERSQHSITLPSLKGLALKRIAVGPIGFHELRDAVLEIVDCEKAKAEYTSLRQTEA